MRASEQVVAPERWRAHCAGLVGSGAAMLDFLAAIDDPGAGEVEVVVHLVDVAGAVRHLVRTRVDRADASLDSLVDLLPGAAWHEREAHEMVGVTFRGNDDLRPLLTDGGAGHPLRRTTALPRRLATPWPGASDPADRPAGAPGRPTRPAARPRARLAAPGIPEQWIAPGQHPGGAGTPRGPRDPGSGTR